MSDCRNSSRRRCSTATYCRRRRPPRAQHNVSARLGSSLTASPTTPTPHSHRLLPGGRRTPRAAPQAGLDAVCVMPVSRPREVVPWRLASDEIQRRSCTPPAHVKPHVKHVLSTLNGRCAHGPWWMDHVSEPHTVRGDAQRLCCMIHYMTPCWSSRSLCLHDFACGRCVRMLVLLHVVRCCSVSPCSRVLPPVCQIVVTARTVPDYFVEVSSTYYSLCASSRAPYSTSTLRGRPGWNDRLSKEHLLLSV